MENLKDCSLGPFAPPPPPPPPPTVPGLYLRPLAIVLAPGRVPDISHTQRCVCPTYSSIDLLVRVSTSLLKYTLALFVLLAYQRIPCQCYL